MSGLRAYNATSHGSYRPMSQLGGQAEDRTTEKARSVHRFIATDKLQRRRYEQQGGQELHYVDPAPSDGAIRVGQGSAHVVHMGDLFTTSLEARHKTMKTYRNWRNNKIRYTID